MASYPTPNVMSYRADGAIAQGKAVKPGSDADHGVVASANTDRCIGINMSSDVTAAEDDMEIAMPGGGALALLAEAVSAGDDLVPDSNGAFVKVNAAGDQLLCRAVKDGAIGDLCPVIVYLATGHAAQ